MMKYDDCEWRSGGVRQRSLTIKLTKSKPIKPKLPKLGFFEYCIISLKTTLALLWE